LKEICIINVRGRFKEKGIKRFEGLKFSGIAFVKNK